MIYLFFMSHESLQINILLADDDKDDCLFFKDALEELPLNTRLTTVPDGVQLMHLLRNSVETFNALFLDLNMPRESGFDCLIALKSDPKLRSLPVIIFSTSYDESIADQLYQKGAQYYIAKPADFQQLKEVIHLALLLVAKEKSVQPPREKFLLSHLKTILL